MSGVPVVIDILTIAFNTPLLLLKRTPSNAENHSNIAELTLFLQTSLPKHRAMPNEMRGVTIKTYDFLVGYLDFRINLHTRNLGWKAFTWKTLTNSCGDRTIEEIVADL